MSHYAPRTAFERSDSAISKPNWYQTANSYSLSTENRDTLKAGTPLGVLPGQHDSGFGEMPYDEEETTLSMDQSDAYATLSMSETHLIVPPNGSPMNGEAERDRVMTQEYALDSDSDSIGEEPIEKRLTGMNIKPTLPSTTTGSRPGPRKPRVNLVTSMRTNSISSKSNSISTVQAPSSRSQSPLFVSSGYVSSQTSTANNYRNQPSMLHQSRDRPLQSQPNPNQIPSIFGTRSSQSHMWPSLDIRAMLQQYLQYFLPDKEGDTGLHLAVIHSQTDLLDRLLYLTSKEPSLQSVIDEQNSLYQTPLHLAVHTQQTDMICKLLLSGASLNVPDHKGNTALHIAAQFSSTKCLEELALYVSLQTLLEVVRIRNNDGQTCVHIAAQNGNSDVLRKLKSLGVDIDMQDLKSGKTALHLSVENGTLRDVQFLLETCHANVNATTFTGCTPLHIASGRGDISTSAYLLSQGANPDLQTDEGDTALELAGSEEVMSLLTKAAALKWLY